MATSPRIGSTFTGAGGLDLALSLLWPDAETAWFCEADSHAADVFSHHHPDAPNLGDITAVDWTQVEPVDVLVGGFPCQDISHAGKRAGITEGTRSGLWFHLLDAALSLRPRLLLLENVAAIASGGLDVVLGSLAEAGWDAEWACVRASDVGAPHRRDRWFCVAWPADSDFAGLEGWDAGGVRERAGERAAGEGGSPLLATPTAWLGRRPSQAKGDAARWHDPARSNELSDQIAALLPTPAVNDMGRAYTVDEWDAWTDKLKAEHGNGNGHGKSLDIEARRLLPTPRSTDGPNGGPNQRNGRGVADSLPAISALLPPPTVTQGRNKTSGRHDDSQHHDGTTLQDVAYEGTWGEYGPAIARWEHLTGHPAPAPTDDQGRLSPDFVEWMMGWPAGWTATADSRTQRLKMLGNGVVPQQAAYAYRHLLSALAQEVAA